MKKRTSKFISWIHLSEDARLRITRRPFWPFFALGFVPALLNISFLLGNIPVINGVMSLLATPGTVVTLPLHNVVPGGGLGVTGLIALANGLVYGFAALLIARAHRRRLAGGKGEGG